MLGGFLAGVAALTASSAQAMDLIDDRKAKANGFDIIYEARDLDLPQAERDGLAQVRPPAAQQPAAASGAPCALGEAVGGRCLVVGHVRLRGVKHAERAAAARHAASLPVRQPIAMQWPTPINLVSTGLSSLPPPACLQIRQNLAAAKSRIAESEKRVDSVLESYVSKAYW